MNQTTDSLEVECLPGFDGGLKQSFNLEVTDIQTGDVLTNATEDVPIFTVSYYVTNYASQIGTDRKISCYFRYTIGETLIGEKLRDI